MLSGGLLTILQEVVAADLKDPNSVIDLYAKNDLSGGWEGWLQAVYARAVFAKAREDIKKFGREIRYPSPSALRSDLWFQGGTNIFVELKTQRKGGYTRTIEDFKKDIAKINGLDLATKQSNVIVAFAVFTLEPADLVPLDELRQGYGKRMRYYAFGKTGWEDVTETIRKEETSVIMLACFSAI